MNIHDLDTLRLDTSLINLESSDVNFHVNSFTLFVHQLSEPKQYEDHDDFAVTHCYLGCYGTASHSW